MPTPPPLTQEQRRQANLRSTALRQCRAELKARLKTGELSIYLALCLEEAHGMKIGSLLAALLGYGPKRAAALLDRLGIKPSNTVKSCGPRQIEALLAAIESKAKA